MKKYCAEYKARSGGEGSPRTAPGPPRGHVLGVWGMGLWGETGLTPNGRFPTRVWVARYCPGGDVRITLGPCIGSTCIGCIARLWGPSRVPIEVCIAPFTTLGGGAVARICCIPPLGICKPPLGAWWAGGACPPPVEPYMTSRSEEPYIMPTFEPYMLGAEPGPLDELYMIMLAPWLDPYILTGTSPMPFDEPYMLIP